MIAIGVVLSPGVVSCGGTLEKGGILGHTRYTIQAHLFNFSHLSFFWPFFVTGCYRRLVGWRAGVSLPGLLPPLQIQELGWPVKDGRQYSSSGSSSRRSGSW